MSGRRTSGTSRLSLGDSYRLFPSFPREDLGIPSSGKRLEVPDILLPDIRGLLTPWLCVTIKWPRMSGRRTSGRSRPSLGVQVPALFSFVFPRKTPVQKMSGRIPGSPRHPSSRQPRSSDTNCYSSNTN